MKHLVAIAIVAMSAMAYAGNDEGEVVVIPMDEVREKMEDARIRLANAAQELADAKMRWQRPGRAFLGILIADQGEEGLRVGGISPDSGAARAGVEADDVIVAINDESLVGDDRPIKALHGVLEHVAPGESVRLRLLREGKERSLDVTTTPYIADSGLHRFRWWDDIDDIKVRRFEVDMPSQRERRDLRLADIGEDLGEYFGVDAGVLVLDTPAKSELKPGDILKRIDGAAVSSTEDAYRLLRRLEEDAQAEVRRKNRVVTVNVAASPRIRSASRVLFIGDDEEEHEEEDL